MNETGWAGGYLIPDPGTPRYGGRWLTIAGSYWTRPNLYATPAEVPPQPANAPADSEGMWWQVAYVRREGATAFRVLGLAFLPSAGQAVAERAA